ncbi:hypothetical protein L210DRAFT_3646588 [Boletus edulis BED1]|uniref:Uncharacterized protein n=1 Tax=Boletus edulis BED1 TaxID=1328754 RepID=A0AAD4BSX6_BOLED|nr:hypothetical protein L210DRAFT_3646588 [Boletus edulis BED1]
MPWYSPPTRREVSLVLFSLTTFVLFYNLETSFTSNGERLTSQARKKGTDSTSAGWDGVVYGNWAWEEQQVAENARKHLSDTNLSVSSPPHIFGSIGVNDGILDWAGQIPETTVLKHVPGYTVMDNVFMLNGTLFVVTDDLSFPSLGSIASSSENPQAVPRPSDWQILSTAQAKETLGSFGGLIHGVSWLVTDASPSNYTLFSLWRTYTALDMSFSPDALTLPPPRRIIYPNVPTFMGKQPDSNGHTILRQRSPSGFHPMVVKAAFTTLGLMYAEDWADYTLLHVPFLLKRVVVADQGAAHRARVDLPSFAVPLTELDASREWWEPIRRNVARFLGVPEQAPEKSGLTTAKTVVTYLSRQDAAQGPKVRAADHKALVRALGDLGDGYEVHVVSAEASWATRMRAIAQSTVVVGVYGEHMADCVYIPPSGRAMVMEMFPPKVFVQDTQVSVGALDVRYFAWSEARQHGVDMLPPVAPPDGEEHDEVPVDAGALTIPVP